MRRIRQIPIIDVFAGPGGLGEGFSRLRDASGNPPFHIALSAEKDPIAHRTLLLRSFYRQFSQRDVPGDYYDRLRGTITSAELFQRYPEQFTEANREAWCAELGSSRTTVDDVRKRVDERLFTFRATDRCVLIGGPPCQAYSLAGRSRNKGIENYVFEKDARTRLYIEYLQMLADFRPAVFIMENVKGLLSSRHSGRGMFERIHEDLQEPVKALHREGRSVRGREHTRYEIRSLTQKSLFTAADPADFVLRCERYGAPQARHRVIVVGIRHDLDVSKLDRMAEVSTPVCVGEAIRDLPRLRSGLSRSEDTADAWRAAARLITQKGTIEEIRRLAGSDIADAIIEAASKVGRNCPSDRGAEFLEGEQCVQVHRDWYVGDGKLGGFCNHASRSHIASDLHRYLFAAVFAQLRKRTPALCDFPPKLWPAHGNVGEALEGSMFSDRFRVQLPNRPSTTITSHISKDGHYYIHPDPTQCRSLTVREAARAQTFPDDYFFEGPRTAQYHQVGNAVPPLIANRIASCVLPLLT